MDRDKRIEQEVKRLGKTLNCATSDKKTLIERLIRRAAFLLVVTEDLESELKSRDQFLETTINASQQFIKANPLLKEYRDTVKSYQNVIKQLLEVTKGDETPKDEDPLLAFIGNK